MPCVTAAPRATVVQKLSTCFGVTRTSSTGGIRSTYSDQLLKSISGCLLYCSDRDVAPYVITGVMKATSNIDEEIWYGFMLPARCAAASLSASIGNGVAGSIGRCVAPGGAALVMLFSADATSSHAA